jgi:simple sugar transport system permease protein
MNSRLFYRFIFVLAFALGLGLIVIVLTSREPGNAIYSFFVGPFTNTYFFGNMLSASIPYILTGIASSIAFSASAFNLGLEGQLYIGAFIGTYLTCCLSTWPPIFVYPLVFAISFLAGGIISAVSGYLKVKRNVNELISSLLVSYALIYICDFFIESVFKDPSAGMAATPYFDEKFLFDKFLPPSDLHTGFWIAIGVAVFSYVLIKKSAFGFEISLTGKNKVFSRYAGLPVEKITVVAMLLSGGIAGIAGMADIFGVHGRMIRGFSTGYGWNGIAVALIGHQHPLYIIPAALFFAYLESGANVGSLFSDITPEIARTIQAAVFYAVTTEGVFSFIKRKKTRGDTNG